MHAIHFSIKIVIMYNRQINQAPEKLVVKGKPVFGTYTEHVNRLDIRGVIRPFGALFMPSIITNLRIKSRLSTFVKLGDYACAIDFFDAKAFGYATVILWNTKTLQKIKYRSIMGPRRRFVPHSLDCAATLSYRKSRYIRIAWDRKANKFSIIFNLKGKNGRPKSNAALISSFSDPNFAEITTVCPSPTQRRCSADHTFTSSIHGAITLKPQGQKPVTMEDTDGISIFDMRRVYLRFHSKGTMLCGMGQIDGHQLSFRISVSNHNAVDQDTYNHNVLFVDGIPTPLPPVTITQPMGISKTWVIQDMENMIDLNFEPKSFIQDKANFIAVRFDFNYIYGTFEGTLMDSNGHKYTFKKLDGIIKKYLIRL